MSLSSVDNYNYYQQKMGFRLGDRVKIVKPTQELLMLVPPAALRDFEFYINDGTSKDYYINDIRNSNDLYIHIESYYVGKTGRIHLINYRGISLYDVPFLLPFWLLRKSNRFTDVYKLNQSQRKIRI